MGEADGGSFESFRGGDLWSFGRGLCRRILGSFRGRGGGLLDDLGGGFVFAEAEEGGLAELVVRGPGGEADLGDEGGSDPDGSAAGFGGGLLEGGFVRLQGFEPGAELPGGLLGEAGAGASGIDELLVLVISEEECSDACRAVGREGEAADDELLLVEAFHLEPGGGPAAGGLAVGTLGDDAFGVELAGLLEHELAVGFHVLGEAEVGGGRRGRGGRPGVFCVRAGTGRGGCGLQGGGGRRRSR